MSRISVPETCEPRRERGFTLVEVMVATSLAAILLTAVLGAYLFLGRNLTRLVNFQGQDVYSRKALRYFTTDVSSAIQLTTTSDVALTLTKPTAGANVTVSYSYSSGAGTLMRTEGATTVKVLTGLTAFSFTYYSESGTVITGSPQSVKAVEFSYTSAAGSSGSGTRASYTSVSPRVLVRNKQVLQ